MARLVRELPAPIERIASVATLAVPTSGKDVRLRRTPRAANLTKRVAHSGGTIFRRFSASHRSVL